MKSKLAKRISTYPQLIWQNIPIVSFRFMFYLLELDRELKAITIIQQEVDDLAAIRDNAAKIKKQNEDLLLKLKLELSAKLDGFL